MIPILRHHDPHDIIGKAVVVPGGLEIEFAAGVNITLDQALAAFGALKVSEHEELNGQQIVRRATVYEFSIDA